MDEHTGTGLPASIELAWGIREPPNKGPKRGLSVGRIIEAAIALADAEGLRAVSMGKVAAELGASTMALYRYVATKDELVTLMADAAAGPPPNLSTPDVHWRSGLARWARALREGMLAHPWYVQIPITGPPVAPNNVAWMEQALGCLQHTAMTPGERMGALLLLSGYVRSQLTLEIQIADALVQTGKESAAWGYGNLLAALIEPARFPAVQAVVDAGVFDGEPEDPAEDFEFGLQRVLDGLEMLVAGRS